QIGEMYHRCHGLSVLAVRIGWLPRDRRALEHIGRNGANPAYLSHLDAQRFFINTVEAEDVGFHTLYAVSAPPSGKARFDLETPRRVIGYEPASHYPDGWVDE